MRPLPKVRACLALNVGLLAAVFGCAVAFASDAPYFRWGPHADLVVVSVVVDTPGRYAALLVLLAAAGVVKVLVSEIGEPVLIFNVYNPDKAVITDFSRTQLLVYANVYFLVSNARRVFEVLVTVTQIDIALFAVCSMLSSARRPRRRRPRRLPAHARRRRRAARPRRGGDRGRDGLLRA